jgi:hypothetical protein
MNNITRATTPNHTDQIEMIRRGSKHPIIRAFSSIEIQNAWELFSSDYCASFLNVTTQTVKDFDEWLSE